VCETKKDQKDRGRYLGGKIPYGFEAVDGALVAIPEQQAVIEAAKALRASEKPLRAIQAVLLADHQTKLSLDAISRIVST
jgi:putative DNA-invertase from lambdoid prophage Rac